MKTTLMLALVGSVGAFTCSGACAGPAAPTPRSRARRGAAAARPAPVPPLRSTRPPFVAGVRPVRSVRSAPAPQMAQLERAAPAGLVAASLALALSAAQPVLTNAVEPPAVVQQYGGSMLAVDEDLREAQAKFLEQRAKMATSYETETAGTYKTQEETKDKKNVYVTIVGGVRAAAADRARRGRPLRLAPEAARSRMPPAAAHRGRFPRADAPVFLLHGRRVDAGSARRLAARERRTAHGGRRATPPIIVSPRVSMISCREGA